jgi:nitrogen regulatory protein P-II 1
MLGLRKNEARDFSGSVSNTMKRIEAVFVPYKFDQVRAAMTSLGLSRFHASELNAHEPEQASNDRWGGQWQEDFSPRLKLEMVVEDEIARKVALAILRAARTRHARETSVTMTAVESVVEIDEIHATEPSPTRQVVSLHA